jgi:hypothetical protein
MNERCNCSYCHFFRLIRYENVGFCSVQKQCVEWFQVCKYFKKEGAE